MGQENWVWTNPCHDETLDNTLSFSGLQFILILQRAQSLKIGPLPHSVPDHTPVTLGEKEVTPNTCITLQALENPWGLLAGSVGGWEHLQLSPLLFLPQERQNWSNWFSWATWIPALSTETSKLAFVTCPRYSQLPLKNVKCLLYQILTSRTLGPPLLRLHGRFLLGQTHL